MKLQFQVTTFETMAFSAQGVLRHDSWCFRKMRLQALQLKKNQVKWMLELKVVLSQSWRKRVDFPYLEIFQVLLQKWPIMSCIQTWSSTWNLLLTKKMALSRYLEWYFETWAIQNLQNLRELWIVDVGKKSWNDI